MNTFTVDESFTTGGETRLYLVVALFVCEPKTSHLKTIIMTK